jgi:hypothetical protein
MARLKCQRCTGVFDGRSDAKYCGGSCRAAAAKERRQKRSKAQPRPAGRTPSVLAPALTRAIRKLPRTGTDAGLVALAKAYARALDRDPEALAKLGPQYLAVLTSLGMTRRNARQLASPAELDLSPLEAGAADRGPSKLDELRRRRAERGLT